LGSEGPTARVPVIAFSSRVSRAARIMREDRKQLVMTTRNHSKQNVTISLDRQLLKKARILAAKRETSISGLLAQEIEALVGEEEAYQRAECEARALLEKGFHLGGVIRASRDALHER
jgi:uncharacterized protein YigA (DUF484 family)